jgi:hypothetical protein
MSRAVDGTGKRVGGADRRTTPVPTIGVAVLIMLSAAAPACFSNTCTRSLSESQCPPSYEAIGDRDCAACRAHTFACPKTAMCGSFAVYTLNGGYGGTTCYYDATTRALVADITTTDTNAFCDGESFKVGAGVSVGACENPGATSTLEPYCPAGGNDGGSD